MKLNDCIHGFTVVRARDNEGIGGTMWELIHEKTGARLVWLDNGAENKLFSIAFKTVPSDDTGVFHILEHSVLNGSDKYTVREPFVNLLKGSLNTFLNAMTYPDKTVYPVSSRNDKDFLNLTSVYLDAVFAPAIYHNPFIFEQEGWHFELAEDATVPTYNGVVFNEMKGAYSSPDTLLNAGIMRLLYPDTAYRHESGGHPAHIPELTYEQFLADHRENYHPSNAYVYLDGAVPLESVLSMLNGYFTRYEKAKIHTDIGMQQTVPFAEAQETYDGTAEDGAMLILGKLVSDFTERKKNMALSLLCDYLAGTNESPLKKAILDSGIAPEVSMYLADEVMQPFVAIQLRQVDVSRRDELMTLLQDTLAQQAQDGLNGERLLAMIDQLEFSFRDMSEPRGLIRNVLALSAWLYGGDPLSPLVCTDVLAQLRAAVQEGYFEDLLRQLDFAGDNAALLILTPDEEKAEADRADEAARLEAASAAWDDETRRAVRENGAALMRWQAEEDSPEALATLPTLEPNELPQQPLVTPTERDTVGGCTVLWHDAATNGVTHYHLYFSLADCSAEELQALSLLTNLLGDLPTETKTVAQLEYEQRKLMGLLNYHIRYFDDLSDVTGCRPYFTVTFSVLDKNAAEAVKLVREILCRTKFDTEEFSFLANIILQQCKESLYQSILEGGNRYAFRRAASHFFAKDALSEQTDGVAFYGYICEFLAHYETRLAEFSAVIQGLLRRVFNSARMTVSVCGSRDTAVVNALTEVFAGDAAAPQSDVLHYAVDGRTEREYIVIPSPVSYAANCCNSRQGDAATDGTLDVLTNILRYDYLWNEIRVKGGAYGCGFLSRQNGALGFTTSRDPSPMASLHVIERPPRFLDGFCAADRDLNTYLIGAVSASEPLVHVRDAAFAADSRYFAGVTEDDRTRCRTRLLNTDAAALQQHSRRLADLHDDFAVCVIGSKTAAPDDAAWKVWKL